MTKKVLILVGDEFEDIEALYPLYRFREEGFEVTIASYREKVSGKHGYTIKIDKKLGNIDPKQYDILVLPGGRGPERIRLYARDEAIKIVRHFAENNKPILAICHGPQLLVSADVVRGRRLTSYAGIRDDLVAAGAKWIDAPVVVDGNLITSRVPSDIPDWFREAFRIIREQK